MENNKFTDYVRKKITALRMQKGVSEYKMSLDLGHSKSYIQSISSGRALPSLPEFLSICEYFQITPKDFFDTTIAEPILLNKLIMKASSLSSEDLNILIAMAERLNTQAHKASI